MNAKKLYRHVRGLWPFSLNIADGELTIDGGGYFPALSAAWERAELAGRQDTFVDLAIWTFYQELHSEACKARRLGRKELQRDTVNFVTFDNRLRQNLASNSWETERASYEKANGRVQI